MNIMNIRRYLLLVLILMTVNDARAFKLFAVSDNTNEVYRYEISGPNDFPNGPERIITDPSFNGPAGAAISSFGELFVTNRGGSVTRLLNPAGNPLQNGTITDGFALPIGITFRNNELFVANGEGGNVVRFLVNGIGPAVPNGDINITWAARGVTVHPTTGELFVSRCCGYNDVLRFTFDASGQAIFNGTITGGGLNSPHLMTFSSWGELFVASPDNPSISRFIFDGSGNAISNGQITGPGITVPIGVAFSPWGELFVGNQGFDPDAKYISRWTFNAQHEASANGVVPSPGPIDGVAFLVSYPFSAFEPTAYLELGPKPDDDSFKLTAEIKLAPDSNGINPPAENVYITVGNQFLAIPAGKFEEQGAKRFIFDGTINNVAIKADIHLPHFKLDATGANLNGTVIPLNAQIAIGDDQVQATLDVGKATLGKGK